eukprot:scaffold7052_cov254-Pinguiococcus_pyrenoidosus.AAC.48
MVSTSIDPSSPRSHTAAATGCGSSAGQFGSCRAKNLALANLRHGQQAGKRAATHRPTRVHTSPDPPCSSPAPAPKARRAAGQGHPETAQFPRWRRRGLRAAGRCSAPSAPSLTASALCQQVLRVAEAPEAPKGCPASRPDTTRDPALALAPPRGQQKSTTCRLRLTLRPPGPPPALCAPFCRESASPPLPRARLNAIRSPPATAPVRGRRASRGCGAQSRRCTRLRRSRSLGRQ